MKEGKMKKMEEDSQMVAMIIMH